MDALKPLFDSLFNALRSVGVGGRWVELAVQVLVYGAGAAVLMFAVLLCLGTMSTTIVSLLHKRGYSMSEAERVERQIYRLVILLVIGAAVYVGLDYWPATKR